MKIITNMALVWNVSLQKLSTTTQVNQEAQS
jgi:hypothetical protein